MKLTDTLRQAASSATSMFSAQLLKEDIVRLEKLEQLARVERDPARYRHAAMVLGWTQGDFRTFELNPELEAFVTAVFEHLAPQPAASADVVQDRWSALHRRRMDLLVGCLSRPRID